MKKSSICATLIIMIVVSMCLEISVFDTTYILRTVLVLIFVGLIITLWFLLRELFKTLFNE